ncbi:hypothetical protein C2E19_11545 [Pseudomonas sp. DTU12.3]|nr:hypothetical protein C2E19_11545 [Pseudomonas sp. DTU12.3]
MWERACSRKRCTHQLMHRLIRCFREQARSHMGSTLFSGGVISHPAFPVAWPVLPVCSVWHLSRLSLPAR